MGRTGRGRGGDDRVEQEHKEKRALRGRPRREKRNGRLEKVNDYRDVCASFQQMGTSMRGTR